MYFRYAEKFGVNPGDVPRTVTVQTWQRWLLWEQAQAARDAWNEKMKPAKQRAPSTQQDLSLIAWSMTKESD